MREAIAKLKLTSNSVGFWLAMMNEMPRGATADQKGAYMLFCKTASDISSIVGHTCGVERAGKACKQRRKSMEEKRATKAAYVFSNYNLLNHKQTAGDSFAAFKAPDSAGEQAAAAAEKDPYSRYTLRRGILIFNDVTEHDSGSDGEESVDEEDEGGAGGAEGDEGEEGAARSRGISEARWSIPDGFSVATEPSTLDGSLVNSAVYMRWDIYGWQMGKITSEVTNATPRLAKKFNYRIVWADGTKGPAKLQVGNYGHGSHARYSSWVRDPRATARYSRGYLGQLGQCAPASGD